MTINLLTYLLLIVPIVSFGQQTMNGTYCDIGSGYGGECLTLTDQGTFVLDGTSCFGEYYGNGTYRFKNDTLILKFLDEQNRSSEIKILEETNSKIDTIKFQVSTKDKNQGTVPFTEISFYRSFPENEDDAIHKAKTDRHGNLTTEILQSENVEYIKAWYVGKKPVIQKIKSGYDYSISVEINLSDTSFITNGLREYKFKEVNQNSIQLGRLEWKDWKMKDYERIKH